MFPKNGMDFKGTLEGFNYEIPAASQHLFYKQQTVPSFESLVYSSWIYICKAYTLLIPRCKQHIKYL